MYFKGPIFIVGMNGSGTTMLADCLNNHPLIFIPRYESKVIPYYFIRLTKYGDLSVKENFEKLLFEFSNTHVFRLLENNVKKVKIPYDFEKIQNKNLSNVINLTFNYFANKHGKKIWGDHSPKYASCLQILDTLFSDCKIIHIIRDPRDCALSFQNRFGTNLTHTALQWKKIVQNASSEGSKLGPDRYFELHYEELTVDAETKMKMIFDFLDLPYDSVVLKSRMPMFNSVQNGPHKEQTIVPNSGKWKSALSPKQVKKIENIAGKTMINFGYEVLHNAGDSDLPRILVLWHKAVNKLRATNAILKEDRYPGRYSRFGRVVISSVKQMRYFKY